MNAPEHMTEDALASIEQIFADVAKVAKADGSQAATS